MKVAINGFGRIGRTVFRAAMERGINIVAINDTHGPKDAAYLSKYDSVYGRFRGKISTTKDSIIVNRKKILVVSERDPKKLPWKKLGVDVVIESTGAFTNAKLAADHLKAGAKKVIITAPADNHDATIIPGVNHKKYKKNHNVISIASCTTNALTPTIKVLNEKFGVKQALMSTVHGYTNTQSLQDSYNKKPRRGRAAADNIIPTTTGAATATIEALPEMKGKLNGMAFRVPVISGSIIDVVVELKKKATVKQINSTFKKAANSSMKGIIEYTEDPLVSNDIIGNPHSVIIDGLSTMVQGNLVKVLGWYDNEHGYSSRVVDFLEQLK